MKPTSINRSECDSIIFNHQSCVQSFSFFFNKLNRFKKKKRPCQRPVVAAAPLGIESETGGVGGGGTADAGAGVGVGQEDGGGPGVGAHRHPQRQATPFFYWRRRDCYRSFLFISIIS